MSDITAQLLEDEVRSAIESWEDRVTVLEIIVTPDEDYNRYKVAVTFRIINQLEEQTLEVYLQRER
jgi:phage baseplate assembly protein W